MGNEARLIHANDKSSKGSQASPYTAANNNNKMKRERIELTFQAQIFIIRQADNNTVVQYTAFPVKF